MAFDEDRVRSVTVAVLDLELTGLSPRSDRICEVAVVRGSGGRVQEDYSVLVRPGVKMSPGAVAVTGITDDLLSNELEFGEVAPRTAEMLGAAVVVAHNVPFDLGFLHREMDAAAVEFKPPTTLDTLMMARRLFAFPKNNLYEVCAQLGVEVDREHRALDDARVTFDVLHRMLEIIDPGGNVTVGELQGLVDALAPNSKLRVKQRRVLRECLRDRRSVWIEYQSTSDPKEGLICREVDIWHARFPRFHCWCHLRNAERVFRLDRVVTVQRSDRVYEIPSDFTRRI